MTFTAIYAVGEDHCELVDTVPDAWRGAMYVWNDIAKRYFGLACFPSMFETEMRRRIWNAGNEYDLTEVERIVLASTMDYVTVKASDIARLIEAFEQYGETHENSSFMEQASILKATSIKEGRYIAWCQMSLSGFVFMPSYDDDIGKMKYSDLSSSWDLFSQIDEKKAA